MISAFSVEAIVVVWVAVTAFQFLKKVFCAVIFVAETPDASFAAVTVASPGTPTSSVSPMGTTWTLLVPVGTAPVNVRLVPVQLYAEVSCLTPSINTSKAASLGGA